MIADAIELSRNSLDAVLEEPITEIVWCQTYYPSSENMKPSLFIQSSTDIAQIKCGFTSENIIKSWGITKLAFFNSVQDSF